MSVQMSGVQSWLAENGTTKVDKVAMNDLAFWLPHTKEYLNDGVPFASDFDSLMQLPVAQIGHILGIYSFFSSIRCVIFRVNPVNHSSPRR